MLVWKDRVLNNHSLHRGREYSSYLLAPQAVPQYSCSFMSVLCSQVRPCPTREDKLMSLLLIASSSSLDLVIWGDICVIRAIIAMGSRKGLCLSAHGGKLGGTRVWLITCMSLPMFLGKSIFVSPERIRELKGSVFHLVLLFFSLFIYLSQAI